MRLRELAARAPDSGPWIRRWESLSVHGMTGDGVLAEQRNVDLAVAAVNALPGLLDVVDAAREWKAARDELETTPAHDNGIRLWNATRALDAAIEAAPDAANDAATQATDTEDRA